MERHICRINHIELRALVPGKIETVILPVGTIEAHGITPLATDMLIPNALAERLAPEIGALIAPAVPYGITKGLYGHPGTVFITPQVFKAYVADVIASLAKTGFDKIVVLNGHGGQITELQDACFEASKTSSVKTLLINWWMGMEDICRKELEREGGHAGADETAAVMAIDPGLVKRELYDEKMILRQTGFFRAYPFPTPMITYAEGDARLNLDEAKCRAYFNAVTARLLAAIKEILAKWE
ncbi:MAG: creatininase family protein [bacterium]